MVDLNKEIKLSDLFKRSKKGGAPAATTGKKKSRKKQPKKLELVGLKVGASQLAAAKVVNNGGVPRVTQVARADLEPGIVVSGEVRDVEALARALDAFFTTYRLPRKGIRVGIGTNRIGVQAVEINGVADERQLANAVRFRAYEAFAIPMDDAVLDYHVLSENMDESGGVTRRVLLAAAYKDPIDQFVRAFQSARLELVGIDVEAFALLRAVATEQVPTGSKAAVVAITLGHDRSTLAISDGEACDFMRVIEWGGGRLDGAVSRDLGLTLEEAAEVKRQLSLEEDVHLGQPLLERGAGAVKTELQVLARELVASLQAYQSEPGSLPIGEVLVTGGTSRMPGLVPELERLIRARVRMANPLAGVRAEGSVSDRDDLASLAVAIGLGVER
jgi:type IV pilus assembly protein PilM